MRVVPNPVPHDDVAAMAAAPLDHPWFDEPGVPVILSAGRLVGQKDFSTLIRAFAQVVKSRPARLVILGEGRERGALAALARELGVAEGVDLPGFVANPFAWMARARVFAVSSIYEGLSMVLVEAMACGTPVVSTDCPHGPRELLEDGRWGRLVPVGAGGASATGEASLTGRTLAGFKWAASRPPSGSCSRCRFSRCGTGRSSRVPGSPERKWHACSQGRFRRVERSG